MAGEQCGLDRTDLVRDRIVGHFGTPVMEEYQQAAPPAGAGANAGTLKRAEPPPLILDIPGGLVVC